MIVRNLHAVVGSEREVAWGNGKSRRLLLADDQLGYSLTDTTVEAGTESHLEYKHHKEACYCIEGSGEIQAANGEVFSISAGTLYALDKNEPHVLRAHTRMRLICVFLPALVGPERHDLSQTTEKRASHYPLATK